MANISGTSGDDILVGTPQDDTITTDTGNDTVTADAGDDLIIVHKDGEGTVDGGLDYDTVSVFGDQFGYSFYDTFSNSVWLFTNIGQYTLTNVERVEGYDDAGANLTYLHLLGDGGADVLDGTIDDPSVQLILNGLDGNDTLNAGSHFAEIYGGEGNDTLNAGAGGSSLYGGAGADTINAGTGDDLLVYSDSNAGVTVDLSGVNANTGGEAQGDVLNGQFEALIGSNFADNLTGSAYDEHFLAGDGDDIVNGGDGDDSIDGSFGSDTLTGGAGNDTFQNFQYGQAFADTITDFEIGDKIDMFHGIINGVAIVPTFIGTNAFNNVVGEMRYEKVGGQTLIHLDEDGDGVTDHTQTISNGEFDLVQSNTHSFGFSLNIPNVITPNIVTTIDDEIAEDFDLQIQGNDGNGLSLREAIAIANDTAGVDTITYDTNVLNQFVDTSPNGTIEITDDLVLSTGVTIYNTFTAPIFDIDGGITVTNDAFIQYDLTNSTSFPSTRSAIDINGQGATLINSNSIYADGFGTASEDRTNAIQVNESNVTINNLAGAAIISQGRTAINSFAFDPITSDYIPDYLTVNNDGTIESQDDAIRLGTGTINNTGTIRATGEFDFGGFFATPGFVSDGISVVNDLDANFVPGPDGVVVINNSATGFIEGARSGIAFSSGGTINNDGTITGETTGLFTQGFHDFSNIFILNNSGNISAGSADYGLNVAENRGGVTVFGGLDMAEINNSGTISSGYYGIYSAEGLTLVNTSTGQIIGDTDGSGDDEVSFYGSQEADFEVEGVSQFIGIFNGLNFVSSQNITIDANSHIVISGVAYMVPSFQVETIQLTNVDAPVIFPLIDIAATQADPNGAVVFQTDANGIVFPATISVTVPSFGTLNVAISSGQVTTVTDTGGNAVFAVNPANDYEDSIDNSGFMSGDIITGLGNDAIINRGNIDGDIYLGEGNDNYTAGAAGLSGDIYGGDGSDVVNARSGNQAIFGEDGNDFLRGGEGNDSLHGGFGADFLRGGEGADVLNGFAGTDWADYITSSAGVTVDLLAGVGTGGEAQGDTYLFIERVYGSNHSDNITGDNGANYLRGAGGDDMLFGGVGNDFLQGDAGADTLDGGAGSDFAYYASSSIGLTIDLGTPSNSTGEAAGDTYISIENIVGSNHNDIIYGDDANNFLRGLNGNDQLFGGDGADFLRGDAGADDLDGGNGLDWAYYAASNGAVTVDLSSGVASGGHAAGDTFTSIERLFGSVFGDTFTGDGNSNYLRGFSGNDTLNGGAGTDFLQGDAGADFMDGGAGTDWVYYVSARTGVTADLGDSANNTGEAAGDSYISIESLRGSNFDDILTGDAGTNFIVGGNGADIITGGAGNDTMRGDAGADTFVFVTGTQTDKVIDYNDAEDMLDFSGFGFIDINDALSNAVDTAGGDVVFTIGSDVITIEDTTISDIMDNLII